MKNFYFTFGTAPYFPFRLGYIIIEAKSYDAARDLFRQRFGFTPQGFLAFSEEYTEEEWKDICDEFAQKYGPERAQEILGPCHAKF